MSHAHLLVPFCSRNYYIVSPYIKSKRKNKLFVSWLWLVFPWCIFPHPFTLRLHLVWSETEPFPALRELREPLSPPLLWHCLPRLLHFYPFHMDLSIRLKLKGTLKLLGLGSCSQNFALQLLVTFVSQKYDACLLNLASLPCSAWDPALLFGLQYAFSQKASMI